MPWPGLMGYNHQLRDFDLRLAANTALASLIISKEHFESASSTNGEALPWEASFLHNRKTTTCFIYLSLQYWQYLSKSKISNLDSISMKVDHLEQIVSIIL